MSKPSLQSSAAVDLARYFLEKQYPNVSKFMTVSLWSGKISFISGIGFYACYLNEFAPGDKKKLNEFEKYIPNAKCIYQAFDIPDFHYITRCFPSKIEYRVDERSERIVPLSPKRKPYYKTIKEKYTILIITIGSIELHINTVKDIAKFAPLENFLGAREALRILPLPIANEILLHF